MIDIYERKNFEISFDPKDTDEVREYLNSIYNFKEKGKHSIYTNSIVDWWELLDGKVIGNCLALDRMTYWDCGNRKYGRQLKNGIKLLNLSSVTEITVNYCGVCKAV